MRFLIVPDGCWLAFLISYVWLLLTCANFIMIANNVNK